MGLTCLTYESIDKSLQLKKHLTKLYSNYVSHEVDKIFGLSATKSSAGQSWAKPKTSELKTFRVFFQHPKWLISPANYNNM